MDAMASVHAIQVTFEISWQWIKTSVSLLYLLFSLHSFTPFHSQGLTFSGLVLTFVPSLLCTFLFFLLSLTEIALSSLPKFVWVEVVWMKTVHREICGLFRVTGTLCFGKTCHCWEFHMSFFSALKIAEWNVIPSTVLQRWHWFWGYNKTLKSNNLCISRYHKRQMSWIMTFLCSTNLST